MRAPDTPPDSAGVKFDSLLRYNERETARWHE